MIAGKRDAFWICLYKKVKCSSLYGTVVNISDQNERARTIPIHAHVIQKRITILRKRCIKRQKNVLFDFCLHPLNYIVPFPQYLLHSTFQNFEEVLSWCPYGLVGKKSPCKGSPRLLSRRLVRLNS
jgi:hypothetical protein